jgi:hypothetical protein
MPHGARQATGGANGGVDGGGLRGGLTADGGSGACGGGACGGGGKQALEQSSEVAHARWQVCAQMLLMPLDMSKPAGGVHC